MHHITLTTSGMWPTCIAHVGLPAQLTPAVRAKIKVPESSASFIHLPREGTFGGCLSGPGACCQHLHASSSLSKVDWYVMNSTCNELSTSDPQLCRLSRQMVQQGLCLVETFTDVDLMMATPNRHNVATISLFITSQ